MDDRMISVEKFTKEVFEALDEIFEHHHGIALDRGTSLFRTLESVSAEQASQRVSSKCASLSAQVAHVTFYLEVIEDYLHSGTSLDVDWGEIWRSVEVVTPSEWEEKKHALKETYQRIRKHFTNVEHWNDQIPISSILAILMHSAYHLGEIRQALCILS
jgi:hypothetical protein